jgi:very-short-patch-repair endonuclease
MLKKMKDVSIKYPMYYGATPDVFKKAKELRRYETEAEKRLWAKLCRNQILGLQFRRQHPINRFIVDFYCVRVKLVIEVDGKIHDIPENRVYDIGRSQILNDFEITVIRFTNEMIIGDLENVIKIIEKTVKQLIVEIE